MKRIALLALLVSLLLSSCGQKFDCSDARTCVTIGSGEPIVIAVELTLSGPDAPYGIDALRGVELAIADHGGKVLNHPVVLVQEDDLCSAEGGQAAAERLAQNPDVLGVIGATCSSASETAAKVLTDAGLVMISPSSSAASLTSEESHQAGFLRTIQNDKSQAKMVAEFAYIALGARTMAAIHDGTPYSEELQREACAVFSALGGKCVASYHLESGTNPQGALNHILLFNPEVLYYPLYTVDGVAITKQAAAAGLENAALISSDGLLSSDFVSQTTGFSQGMYISGPSVIKIEPSFYEKYEARYGEKPIAVYAAQAYDAAMMLFRAIEASAKTTGRDIYITRQTLLAALYSTKGYQGLSGTLTCSSLGDCATPNVVIYQVHGLDFAPIYP
ncbi:MAG: branched-chain amino acid ABC transporter substrate-binding protein [Anaerolineaceae bacterium]|nr:MAG: branched-chain amino acid ABC transporter substrate-binding protein [Anaerolineaceae bacterium]